MGFFLNKKKKKKHELNADYVINVIAMGNADFYDRPELFRPPFDRVPESYLVRTNPDGFRERKFPKHSRQKSIVILGDSVGFLERGTRRRTIFIYYSAANTKYSYL